MSNDTFESGPVILAYCDKNSARSGDEIRFMVSCEGIEEYRADVVRLGCCDTGQAKPPFRESMVETEVSGTYTARRQAITVGSSVSVPDPRQLTSLGSFALQTPSD